MRKIIGFRQEEEKVKGIEYQDNNVYNGFGEIWQKKPPTYYSKIELNNFDPQKIGKLFVELGEKLKQEPQNINNISIKWSFIENSSNMGKLLDFIFEYDTCKEGKTK